jgi:hypothetical protein
LAAAAEIHTLHPYGSKHLTAKFDLLKNEYTVHKIETQVRGIRITRIIHLVEGIQNPFTTLYKGAALCIASIFVGAIPICKQGYMSTKELTQLPRGNNRQKPFCFDLLYNFLMNLGFNWVCSLDQKQDLMRQ